MNLDLPANIMNKDGISRAETGLTTVSIQRLVDGQWLRSSDVVACEEPLEIRLLQKSAGGLRQDNLSVTMRTPGDDLALAAGYLFSEGIIREYSEIVAMEFCAPNLSGQQNVLKIELSTSVPWDFSSSMRHTTMTSSCGVCGKTSIASVMDRKLNSSDCLRDSTLQIPAHVLVRASQKLNAAQPHFQASGGTHACALFDANGELIDLCEDVGRHNAFDKMVGRALRAELMPLHCCFVFLSGRASFELIQKANTAGIPIVCAVGAPSSLAIELAIECGITLLGFVRNERFNVYSHVERLIDSELVQ